jgi:pimeloyl-ACP methyl ester carboxylesterase
MVPICRALCVLTLVLLALLAGPADARAEALIELRLARPPHAPADAPDVIAHLPSRLSSKEPLHVLVFLHGFNSCARALVAQAPVPCLAGGEPQRAYGLAQIHEQAAGNSILLVPQLAFLERDGHAPRFEQSGGFDAFLADVRAQLAKQLDPQQPLASVTLLAHSAGYRASAAILSDPALAAPILNVVLFDALYAQWDAFAAFLHAQPERRVISLYTHDRKTTRGNRNLAAMLHDLHKDEPQSRDGALEQECVDTAHGLIPTRHMAAVLEALRSAPRDRKAERSTAREKKKAEREQRKAEHEKRHESKRAGPRASKTEKRSKRAGPRAHETQKLP